MATGRDLRAALHGGDPETALLAVEQAGANASWQLVGDVILAALAADPESRRGRKVAAAHADVLRDRDWRGDRELAEALDSARAEGSTNDLTELRVDLEELSSVLGSGDGLQGGRIDRLSGDVWSILDGGWLDEDEEEDRSEEGRWLEVPSFGSRDAYQDTVHFASTRQAAALTARLEAALNGRGAFGRFRRALDQWPEDVEEWLSFSDDRRRGRAREWLTAQGFRSTYPRGHH